MGMAALMIIRGAILVCLLAILAAGGSDARGAVATCGDSRDSNSLRAPSVSHGRDWDNETHSDFQRIFCFDHDESSDASHERGHVATFIGHLFHDGKSICIAIDCEKLCANEKSKGGAVAEVSAFCKNGESEKSNDSHSSPLQIADDVAQQLPSESDSSANEPSHPTGDAENSSATIEHDTSQKSTSGQTDGDWSDKNDSGTDGIHRDYGEPSTDFPTDSNTSDFSPNEFPSTVADSFASPRSAWTGANETIPQTASASVSSFSPMFAFDSAEGGATSNPEPASLVIWGGLGAIVLGAHSYRRRQAA
jgi:hypothetical protein